MLKHLKRISSILMVVFITLSYPSAMLSFAEGDEAVPDKEQMQLNLNADEKSTESGKEASKSESTKPISRRDFINYEFSIYWYDDIEWETRPDELVVNLFNRNEPNKVVSSVTLTKNNVNKYDSYLWEGVFKNVPQYDDEEEVIDYFYKIDTLPENYLQNNEESPRELSYEKNAIVIYKSWYDYGMEKHRPSSITFEVYNMDDTETPVETKTVDSVSKDKHSQKIVIDNLDLYDSENNKISYGIKEILNSDYYTCSIQPRNSGNYYRLTAKSSDIRSGTKFDVYNSFKEEKNSLEVVEHLKQIIPNNESIEFTAELSGLTPNEEYVYIIEGDMSNPEEEPVMQRYTTDSDGKASVEFKLKNREHSWFINLPESYTYNITQKSNKYLGYLTGKDISQINKESEDQTLSSGEATSTEVSYLDFYNFEVNTGLIVHKYVEYGRPDDEFTFEVEIDNLEPNKTYTGYKFQFNRFYADEKVKSLLPKAIAMDTSNNDVKIIDNVSITADANGHWSGTIALKHNETWYIADITKVATARVVEKAAEDYYNSLYIDGGVTDNSFLSNEEMNMDLDSGVVQAIENQILSFRFTNTSETGNLYLDKKVTGIRVNPNDEFTFKVILDNLVPNATYKYIKGKSFDDFEIKEEEHGYVESRSFNKGLSLKSVPSFAADENGHAEIDIILKQDEGVVFKNLPQGYKYAIYETLNHSYYTNIEVYSVNPDKGMQEYGAYWTDYYNDSYGIYDDNVSCQNILVRFINRSTLHNVYIGKTQIGGDPNDVFDYQFDVTDLQPNTTYNYYMTDAESTRFEEGVNGTRYDEDDEIIPNPENMLSFTTDDSGTAKVNFQIRNGQVAVFVISENSNFRALELDTKDYDAFVLTTAYRLSGSSGPIRLASVSSKIILNPTYEENKYQFWYACTPVSWPKNSVASNSPYFYSVDSYSGYDTLWLEGETYVEFKNVSNNRILTLDKKVSGNENDSSSYTFDIDIEGLTPNETSTVNTGKTPENDNITSVQDNNEYVTLTYDPNGGEGSPIQTKLMKGSTLLLSDCMFAKEGEVFRCWKINNLNYEPSGQVEIRKDTTAYAQWAKGLLLHYNEPEEVRYSSEENIRREFETFALPNYTRYNYRIVSWNTKADGSGTTYDIGYQWSPDNGSLELYAQWEQIPDMYIVYKNDNFGNSTTQPFKGVKAGETIGSIYTYSSRNNYYVESWNTKPDGSGETYNSDSIMPAHNITLYAQWAQGGMIKMPKSVNKFPSLKLNGEPYMNLQAEAAPNPTEITADANGKYHGTFTLKDGERLTLLIPEGCTYKITEKANECVASYQIKEYEGSVIATKENTSNNTDLATQATTLNNNTNTTFTNTWVNAAPPTGEEKTSTVLIGISVCLGAILAFLLKTIYTKKTI